MLAEDFGAEVGVEIFIDLHLTQAKLASLIGVYRPSVNIALSQFKDDGFLKFRDGHICILDNQALQAAAHKQKKNNV